MSVLTGGLSAVFWGVLLLSILVFVHEGGHYVAARLFKVRVTEFYLGLPCRLRLFHKSRSHGTEVGVTPILLGGYNRICGMEGNGDDELLADAFAIVQREGRVSAEDMASELDVDVDRSYALLVTLSDWAAIRPYYDPDLGETPTQRDYPRSFEALERDANMLTEYDDGHDFSLAGSTKAGEPRPLEDAEKQLEVERGHTYLGCGYLKRLAMLVAGPLVNIVLAFILVVATYMFTEYQMPVNSNTIGDVTADSIAQKAGIKAGDTITSIDGRKTESWDDIVSAIDAALAKGSDFPVEVMRDGQQAIMHIDVPEEGAEVIGVVPMMEPYRLSFIEAVQGALNYGHMVASFAIKLIMPNHTMEVLESSSSIVGISVMASQAASSGFMDVIAFMAAISMSLGFMNLLPIPPLDGGKILIETIQLVMRRTLSVKVQTAISYVGLAFFLFIFLVVVRNDVFRFVLK